MTQITSILSSPSISQISSLDHFDHLKKEALEGFDPFYQHSLSIPARFIDLKKKYENLSKYRSKNVQLLIQQCKLLAPYLGESMEIENRIEKCKEAIEYAHSSSCEKEILTGANLLEVRGNVEGAALRYREILNVDVPLLNEKSTLLQNALNRIASAFGKTKEAFKALARFSIKHPRILQDETINQLIEDCVKNRLLSLPIRDRNRNGSSSLFAEGENGSD